MKNNHKKLPILDISGLYNLRMFILLEKEPQSNKYHRFVLTQDQYKKITYFIKKTIGIKEPNHTCEKKVCDGMSYILEADPEIILPDMEDMV